MLERVNIFILMKVPSSWAKHRPSPGEMSLKNYPVNPNIPLLMSHTLELSAKTHKALNSSTVVSKVFLDFMLTWK